MDLRSQERRCYDDHRAELLAQHPGRHVLIVGPDVVGVFDKPEEAYAVGLARFGNVPMFIHKVQANDPSCAMSVRRALTQGDIVLAAMAPANGAPHTAVQMQKLLFLIDREAADLVGGPFFNFRPYHYGPFDKTVYNELEALGKAGFVDIHGNPACRSFTLTHGGQEQADHIRADLTPAARDYIRRVSEFVRSLSFSDLVSAIYKAYPDMTVNSVFQG